MKYFFLFACLQLFHSAEGQNVLQTGDSPYKTKHINFIPASFSNMFSLNIKPVLRIHSGDTVSTETIDAGGFDKNGVKRQKGR